MNKESEDYLRFILENILCIEDSSDVSIQMINIIEGVEWDIIDCNNEVRFVSANLRMEGSEIDSPTFRKIYSGGRRRKLPIIHLHNEEDDIFGAFQLKAIVKVWKLSIKEKVRSIKLIPFPKDQDRAQYLQIEFKTGIFLIKSILQLFPTDDYFTANIEYSKKYAKAYEKFSEIVPFTIDRIVDLLSTDEIAPSFEAWEENPDKYDIPGVDSADITLARKLASELPAEELNILVRQIREIMTATDWETQTDNLTIERYSKFLKYIKKIRRVKKKEPPEDYSFILEDES
jgi:hypothetical protein